MKTYKDIDAYTVIVLTEATQQLESRDATLDLTARLSNVANILKLLTAYKTLGINISAFLNDKHSGRCKGEVADYANTVRFLLQRDIAKLTVSQKSSGHAFALKICTSTLSI